MWIKLKSINVKPNTIDDTSSPYFVYVRKDITESTGEWEGEEVTFYDYLEAKFKKEDWDFIKELLDTEERSIENSDGILEVYEATDDLTDRANTQEDAILELYEMIGGTE